MHYDNDYDNFTYVDKDKPIPYPLDHNWTEFTDYFELQPYLNGYVREVTYQAHSPTKHENLFNPLLKPEEGRL